MEVKLTRASAALMVTAACVALLAAHALQLHHDYDFLSSRYAELQRSYEGLSLNYSRLEGDYEALSSRFSDLRAEHERLSDQYSLLRDSYSKLEEQYSSLKRGYDALMSRYSSLRSDYESLLELSAKLNETITYVIRKANSYALLRDAMPRVLNSEAVRAAAPAVSDAGVSKSDLWGSIQRMYDYVASNVRYAYDVDVPVWYVSSTVTLGDRAYVYEVRCVECQNYVQSPELTLRIRQGDCEDQAVLIYAMIKYYMREVYGAEYALYLAYVEFGSGSGHMAALMPVQGGRVCIIDPAGRYLTSQYGRITSRPALEELQKYSSHWASEGGIKYVELWNVKLDGSPSVVAKGSVEEVARALS